MKVDELLEDLSDLLEDSKELPVVNKVMVDKAQITDIIDEIKANLPAETRQAKRVVSERNKIIEEARKQAETLISAANKQRTNMLESNEIVIAARAEAKRIIADAEMKSRKIKSATGSYVDMTLQKTEEALAANLSDFRKKRQAITNMKNESMGGVRPQRPAAPAASAAPAAPAAPAGSGESIDISISDGN